MEVVVSGAVLIFIHELFEENGVEAEEIDFMDDFWDIFIETFYANRIKAVRIEGYTQRIVPNYNFGEFRLSHVSPLTKSTPSFEN